MTLLLLLACAPPPADTAAEAADTSPSIVVTYPPPEITVTGCTVVTVDIENLSMVDFTTHTTNVEGEGHWHVYTPAGHQSSFRPYALTTFEDIPSTVSDTLTVQLVNNDHTPLTAPDGSLYEYDVPLTFKPGPCAEFEIPSADTGGSDTGMDTGMR